jgi:hypothetical protein
LPNSSASVIDRLRRQFVIRPRPGQPRIASAGHKCLS